ncbi:MAG: membrane protein insertion efficiency factor YidD [candidate division Zixibacteria bacterium]|nr:membrane protein insertion efficiency factor YidD [candidate division Zixibacteria bacterium]
MLKSADYSGASTIKPERTPLWAWPLIFAIYAYRYTFSPIIGNSCRFYPTCSHYAEDALHKHGAWHGSIMAAKRLLRCHPWHGGGYDPVE